jgi:hypothetical protein
MNGFSFTFISLVLFFVLISPNTSSITLPYSTSIEILETTHGELNDDWYYLSSYPNYCPNGLPDFDQRQDNWKNFIGIWTLCGPTALANIFWWFDSKNSDQNGTPGDGIDIYPLVKNYHTLGDIEPGPHSDDHNFNNVNALQTSWDRRTYKGELIEQIAWYVNTDKCRNPIIRKYGTNLCDMIIGIKKWIKDVGLQDDFKVEVILRPSFSTVNEQLRNNNGILLRLGKCIFDYRISPILFHHYVSVAGINSDGYISISDPGWDKTNPCLDSSLHNDASIVSHDIYKINFTSPFPQLSSWWIPDYAIYKGALVNSAIIISENKSFEQNLFL